VKALLVRVAADSSEFGGSWNGPVDSRSHEFVYVPIPEKEKTTVHPGLEKPFSALEPVLARFGVGLPGRLRERHMHLDPDFTHLTYGDSRQRAKQLRDKLRAGDRIVFYAGLADVRAAPRLVYAIIGMLVVEQLIPASEIPERDWDMNAHSRVYLNPSDEDIVVRGRHEVSGRLRHCLPFGEYRDRAYRVRRDLLDAWGGLSVKDGYVQRSARLPQFLDPMRFLRWLERQQPVLVQANN
jgi:hypothetical protein